jgi:hypothetical protein
MIDLGVMISTVRESCAEVRQTDIYALCIETERRWSSYRKTLSYLVSEARPIPEPAYLPSIRPENHPKYKSSPLDHLRTEAK